MKNNTFFRFLLILVLSANVAIGQVGIGTTSPKGILDVDSSIYGIAYPTVALTATNVAAPVVNPLGGALAVGTTIYNTNTFTSGSNDVEPGIYSWDGTEWVIHFEKREQSFFEQTAGFRPSSALGFEGIPGLAPTDLKTFTSKYSGTYRIELRVNYGGGRVVNNGDVNVTMAEGDFRFIFDGTTELLTTKSFSTYNNHISGGRQYENAMVQTTKVYYVNLVQGATYSFSLEFDQHSDPVLQASGNLVLTNDGRGYIGTDIPCYIEFEYLKE
jgi:hypothetical protein